MAIAYRAGNAEGWRAAADTARGKTPFKIYLEKAYNITAPFPLAMGFYLLGIIILAAERYRKSNRMLFPLLCLGLWPCAARDRPRIAHYYFKPPAGRHAL
jgi:hypothetical protein